MWAKAGKFIFPRSSATMDSFELRRVELLHSSSDADKSRSSKQWYVLDAKICGGYVSKFLSSSPLVLNFPSEFTSVQRSELKNGGILDDRHFQDSKVAIASLFGVVSAILRQKFKEGEAAKYRWLVDAINSLKIGKTEVETSDIDIRPESSGTDLRDQLKAACDAASAIERENDRLKAHLDQAQRQLGSLSEEVKKLKQVIEISERKPEVNEKEKDAKEEKIADQDVWTSISDVCEKFQIYLADVIVNEKHRPEVAQLLSDIAEKIRSNSSSPLQALETVLGDSSVKFFQSLRVPDWTLLYFKLQSRIPDQAWQMLLNICKLGRTGVSKDLKFCCLRFCKYLDFWVQLFERWLALTRG